MDSVKVAIVGSTGATGSSIAEALLTSCEARFEVTALARPSSLHKREYAWLRERGANVVSADLRGPENELARILDGIDIVISAISFSQLSEEIALINASKIAGVKRFLQSAFMVIIPPRGVVDFRQQKDDVLAYIQKTRLPYTYVDAGYWYQLGLPRVPSGRLDYALASTYDENEISVDGNCRMAFADIRDIGRYVARVITDPRTLNRKVHVYSEVLTWTELYDLLKKTSGEQPERRYVTKEEVESRIARAQSDLKTDPANFNYLMSLVRNQLFNSFAVRGDNTPENAEYLGYLNSKELYPDFEYITYESFIKEALEGKARRVYQH